MVNKTNLELLELYNSSDFKHLAVKELSKRVGKKTRAKTGNIHLILEFIPKTSIDDEIIIRRFDGYFKINDPVNTGLTINRDTNNNIIWIE